MSVENRKKKRNRLGKCDVCRSTEAVYTCPRCETVTCSLNCVKKHKKDLDCDGIRVRTKFIPVEKMNENNLLSDYRLLEDVRRCVEVAECRRESLERPQQAIADSTSENSFRIIRATDANKSFGQTVGEGNSNSNCGNAKKNNQKKKSKKSSSLESKCDVLIAKANRIREEILNKQRKAVGKLNLIKTDSVPTNHLTINSEDVKEEFKDENLSLASSEEGPSSGSSITEVTWEEKEGDNSVTIRDGEVPSATSPVAIQIECNQSESKREQELGRKHTLSKVELTRIRKAKMVEVATLGGIKKSQNLEALANAAYSRGTSLSCLPEKFEKHWENTSFFLTNEDCIYWHLKVSFINANFYTLSLNECAETMTLENLVKGCLRRSEEYWTKQARDDPLLVYRKTDLSKISVLMAADKLPNSQRKFYILDVSKSLRENFVGKCIVEFPQILIALEDCHVVSTIQENYVHNFFGGLDFEEVEEKEPKKEIENALRKKKGTGTKRKRNEERKNSTRNAESDRESGELTDSNSSDSFFSDTDSNEESEEELFKESEFRSVYKNLLNTFEDDVNQLCKKK